RRGRTARCGTRPVSRRPRVRPRARRGAGRWVRRGLERRGVPRAAHGGGRARARLHPVTALRGWAGGSSLVRRRSAPELLEHVIAPATPAVDLVTQRILLVVVLVIVLGGIERAGGTDRGDPGLLQHVAPVRLLLPGRRLRELLVARCEDRGGVLRAAVAELAARVGRVDVAPEHLEQLGIA